MHGHCSASYPFQRSLYLRFKGKRTEIGRFLAAAERKKFARMLQSALAKPHI